VHFVEHFQQPRYPAENVDSNTSPIVFLWGKMKGKLDAKNGDWVEERYLKSSGREVSLTLGGGAERLNAGCESPLRQETSSSVYHVISGSGKSTIDDKTFEWKEGDTFCIPAWNKYQHFASGSETVYLYRFDDRPMIKALGYYREAGDDVEKYVTADE